MTFTTRIKKEICLLNDNFLEKQMILFSYLNAVSKVTDEGIVLYSESATVIKHIYLYLKEVFKVSPKVNVRIQKRFRTKQVYFLTIKENVEYITKATTFSDILSFSESKEDKIAYLKGAFLASGSISNPEKNGYHLEFSFHNLSVAEDIDKLLKSFNFNSKIIKRSNKYLVYLKASEEISDIMKLFRTVNSLFFYEDIRTFKDHKNMVNRLNNCEVANQEKITSTGLKQVEAIIFLKENELFGLLDDKTKTVANKREENPEVSYQELAEIISAETSYKIGKSGINHNFIKINKLIENFKGVDK